MGEDSNATAVFLQTVNDILDFVNSSSNLSPPPKQPVMARSFKAAEERFNMFSSFVMSWSFSAVNSRTVKSNLPFHEGWKLCLAAMKGLAEKYFVKEKSLSFLCLNLNQLQP